MLKIGRAELRRVEEMTASMPVSLFTKDQTFLAEHDSWLRPTFMDAAGNLPIVYHSYLLLVEDKLIVIDPCAGNDRSFPNFPTFHMLKTPYLERFEATGFKAEEVDFVFCTHLHADHCGWNTQLRGDRFVPTFPNARYLIVRREFERWDPRKPGHKFVAANAGAFETSVLPAAGGPSRPGERCAFDTAEPVDRACKRSHFGTCLPAFAVRSRAGIFRRRRFSQRASSDGSQPGCRRSRGSRGADRFAAASHPSVHRTPRTAHSGSLPGTLCRMGA
jgi:hypothetical protein